MIGNPDQSLAPGLYFVSTPLGNARDITLRALDILGSAEVLAAEDTRRLRQLMDIHGVPLNGRRILAYHDHNGPRVRPVLIAALAEGKSVAYASDAGTPLVADPGFALAREAIAQGFQVYASPGPSAA
ncbi:MAG: rRNA (cytidine-2'-O-)-methyltransferase, partial [Silicimonas sp.]|nr:rRNA (cytidine-2'-O-)-methyltransferase [Silicimonas sp.]